MHINNHYELQFGLWIEINGMQAINWTNIITLKMLKALHVLKVQIIQIKQIYRQYLWSYFL